MSWTFCSSNGRLSQTWSTIMRIFYCNDSHAIYLILQTSNTRINCYQSHNYALLQTSHCLIQDLMHYGSWIWSCLHVSQNNCHTQQFHEIILKSKNNNFAALFIWINLAFLRMCSKIQNMVVCRWPSKRSSMVMSLQGKCVTQFYYSIYFSLYLNETKLKDWFI